MHQLPRTEISCQEEESINQLLFTDICQQERICQLYFTGMCWQEESMHQSTFTDISCRKQRSIYQLPFRGSVHYLLFTDVPVCTAYLYWHMSTSGKHAPPTLSSCQQEGSMQQLSFTTYASKREVCNSYPLPTHHVNKTEVRASYPLLTYHVAQKFYLHVSWM